MNAIYFLPLLVAALWAIDHRRMMIKRTAYGALLDRMAVIVDYDELIESHHQALLGEYEGDGIL